MVYYLTMRHISYCVSKKGTMRYFKITDKDGWMSIWETDDKKKKERIIHSSDKQISDMEKMKQIWTKYSPPGDNETETEITIEEAFVEKL